MKDSSPMPPPSVSPPRLLSIQSQVAAGHVGHGAAVPALYALGVEVMPLHTALLACHPGHLRHGPPTVVGLPLGPRVSADDLGIKLAALAAMGMTSSCAGGILGYLPSAALAQRAYAAMDAITASGGLVCVDPVMGDLDSGVYVPAEVIGHHRAHTASRADIITPNLFEFELLAGTHLRTLASLTEAMASLIQAARVAEVVVTGVPGARFGAPPMVGTVLATAEGAWLVESPALTLAPTVRGTGDLLTALYVGWRLRGTPPPQALANACAAMDRVLAATAVAGQAEMALVAQLPQLNQPADTEPKRLGGSPTARFAV
jgi:pyridoxine kinase